MALGRRRIWWGQAVHQEHAVDRHLRPTKFQQGLDVFLVELDERSLRHQDLRPRGPALAEVRPLDFIGSPRHGQGIAAEVLDRLDASL